MMCKGPIWGPGPYNGPYIPGMGHTVLGRAQHDPFFVFVGEGKRGYPEKVDLGPVDFYDIQNIADFCPTASRNDRLKMNP